MTALIPHLTGSLGADLRSIRKARGKTLAELAAQLDRSVGWMSQVERDISAPTIEELRVLAATLDVSVSIFFGQSAARAEEEGRVVRAAARRKIGGGAVGLVEELLSPDLTDDFEVVHSEFAPGAKMVDFVQRPTQEVGYIVSGSLRMWIGDQVFDLAAGDSFRVRGEQFRWENSRTEKAVAIWVIAPPVY